MSRGGDILGGLKKAGKVARKVQKVVFDEKVVYNAFIKAPIQGYGHDNGLYKRSLGPAVLQLLAIAPVAKVGKVALAARGLPITERIGVGLAASSAKNVVFHGTEAKAAKGIKAIGFLAAKGRGTFATRDVVIASLYATKRAATSGGRAAVVAATLRKGAPNLSENVAASSIVRALPSHLRPLTAVRGGARAAGVVTASMAVGGARLAQDIKTKRRQAATQRNLLRMKKSNQ